MLTMAVFIYWCQQVSHKDSTDTDTVLEPDDRDKSAASSLSA